MGYLEKLGNHLFSQETVGQFAIVGCCRLWTRTAILETQNWARQGGLALEIEAREIMASPGLDHTFLRVSFGGERYVYDGAGTLKIVPWWGPEAGSRYEGSKPDMIQRLMEVI